MPGLLKTWAMNVAGVAIFGSMCQMLLPEGGFQKYVRLAVGLMLILTLIEPIPRLLRIEPQDDPFALPGVRAYAEREEMDERRKAEVIRIYKKSLETKMREFVGRRLGLSKIEIRCEIEEGEENFGTVRSVLVLVDAEENRDVTKEVQEILEQNCGVSGKNVKVQYLKERGAWTEST